LKQENGFWEGEKKTAIGILLYMCRCMYPPPPLSKWLASFPKSERMRSLQVCTKQPQDKAALLLLILGRPNSILVWCDRNKVVVHGKKKAQEFVSGSSWEATT